MSHVELENWTVLYAATGLCCAIATILSVIVVIAELYREQALAAVRTRRDVALFVPRCWWRWQKRYFLSTPVTLSIVTAFAATMDWAH